MKLTVIGMNSAYPTGNRPSSGYLIETAATKILLDCGSGIMMKLSEMMDLNELHHIYISHAHPDHIADLGVMQHRRLVEKMMNPDLPTLNIYSSLGEGLNREYYSLPHSTLHNIHTTKKIGDVTVSFEQTVHPIECFAIKLESNGKKLVYTSDTAYSEAVLNFAKDADLLITESSLYPKMDGTKPGHMNINEAVDFSLKSSAKQVLLTHLPTYGPNEMFQTVIDQSGATHIQLAEPEMTIEL